MLNAKERLRVRNHVEAQREVKEFAELLGEDYVLESNTSHIRGCYPNDMVDALEEYQTALAKVRAILGL